MLYAERVLLVLLYAERVLLNVSILLVLFSHNQADISVLICLRIFVYTAHAKFIYLFIRLRHLHCYYG